ncbi:MULTISPECIES: DUF6477 family protein [unclassified Paracoccus (in: a-proteobacteria)]|uniref:DUF6477 family protein n=1 Tax=unclassified Paracoccus (in: a-proteobacteria) TaxID=2688777 RepID=UPI001600D346|nr:MULTISPECIES: DUF6477 family protein [unclassified Paracoccus (in: a-proteobacteria)]MBB1492231.1 hypothetical protein [Paracoccus sp. MC1854]MBB1498687.1 hypothetical protein [Paracoccus sp. MC1862]QQO45626.1 hypothetical protein JGR78_04575 [Paracoccus sp. MC1862]
MSLMSNVLAFPAQPVLPRLRRPAALIRAAVAGQSQWRRDRDLRRTLRCEILPPPGKALARLRADEDRMNMARQEGAADYDMHYHVMLMIAILAESRLSSGESPRLSAIC